MKLVEAMDGLIERSATTDADTVLVDATAEMVGARNLRTFAVTLLVALI
jgi:hypothetical protein